MRRSLGLSNAVAAAACLLCAAAASATPATTVQCGEVISQDTKVANDLSGCPGSGLIIGANDVTLDLNGHTIAGDADFDESEEAGVQVRGFDGAVIKDGTLTHFVHVVNAGDFGAVNDTVIRNVAGEGIFGLIFLVGDHNRVERGVFTGGGDGGLFVVGNDNVIFRNSIVGNWEFPIGVRGDRNRITHNVIRAGEDCRAFLEVSGEANVIRHNDATGGGLCAFS